VSKQLCFNISNETFVGQTGGCLKLRYLEHKRHIRTKSPTLHTARSLVLTSTYLEPFKMLWAE